MSKNMQRKIRITDESELVIYTRTIKKAEEWLDIEIPKWCDEISFNDRNLSMSNSYGKHSTVVYHNTHGSWGFPTVMT